MSSPKKGLKNSKLFGFLQKAGKVVPGVLKVANNLVPGNILGAIDETISILSGDERTASKELKEELLQNQKEWKLEVFELEELSRSRATGLYEKSSVFVNQLAARIMRQNLWFALGLLALNVLIALASKRFDLPGDVVLVGTNIITFIIRGLLDERKDVIAFFLGGSVEKDNDL